MLYVAVSLSVVTVGAGCASGEQRFEATEWRQAAECGEAREDMVDDLTKRHLRRGMSREEVRALLGEPQGTSTHDRYYYGPFASWFGDCWKFLLLHFDARGRLDAWTVSAHSP